MLAAETLQSQRTHVWVSVCNVSYQKVFSALLARGGTYVHVNFALRGRLGTALSTSSLLLLGGGGG